MKLLQTWRDPDARRKPKLRFDLVTPVVVTVLIIIFMLQPSHGHHSAVDLARVRYSTAQPDAARDDAITITVTREGKVYCRSDQVPLLLIPDCVRASIAKGARPWVFIKADARARWGVVAEVVEVLGPMGARRVVFIVEQKR